MKRDPGGTLTAICMLIPMVAVPWFAIRGTQDLPSIQSRSDESSELSYTDFETPEGDLTEAPPFPSGTSTVEANPAASDGIEWEDPFGDGSPEGPVEPSQPFGTSPPAPTPTAPPSMAAADFDEFDDSSSLGAPSGGLGGGQVFPGEPRELPDSRAQSAVDPPILLAGQSKTAPPPKNDVTAQWKGMIRQLEGVGMRNYRVETTEDRSEYFFTAFFQDGPALRRIEGQGTHPLTALQSTVKQVREWRRAQ